MKPDAKESARGASARKTLQPGLLLEAGIAVITLGMVLIAIGVISGPFFYPGLFVLIAGFLLTVAAGAWYALPARTGHA